MRVATNRETMDAFYNLEFDCECGKTVCLRNGGPHGGAYYGIPRKDNSREGAHYSTWEQLLLEYDWTREVLVCSYCQRILAEVRIG